MANETLSTMESNARSEDEIMVRIKCIDSSEFPICVRPSWTVATFKEHIAPHVHVEPGRIRLIVAGRVMRNEHTLDQYNLRPDQVIHLVRRPETTEPSPELSAQTAPNTSIPRTNTVHVQMGTSGTSSSVSDAPNPPQTTHSLRTITIQTIPQAVGTGHRPPSHAPLHSFPQFLSSTPVSNVPRMPVISDVTLHVHVSFNELDQLPQRLETLAQQVPFRTRTEIHSDSTNVNARDPANAANTNVSSGTDRPLNSVNSTTTTSRSHLDSRSSRPTPQVSSDSNQPQSSASTGESSTSRTTGNSASNNLGNMFNIAEMFGNQIDPSIGGVMQGLMPVIQNILQNTSNGSIGGAIHTVLAEVPVTGSFFNSTEGVGSDDDAGSSQGGNSNDGNTDITAHIFSATLPHFTSTTSTSNTNNRSNSSAQPPVSTAILSASDNEPASLSLHEFARQNGIPAESSGSLLDNLILDLLQAANVQDVLQLAMAGNWRICTRMHPILMRHIRDAAQGDSTQGRERVVAAVQNGIRSLLMSAEVQRVWNSLPRINNISDVDVCLHATGLVVERFIDFLFQVDSNPLPENYDQQFRAQFVQSCGFLAEYLSTHVLQRGHTDYYVLLQAILQEISQEVIRINPNFAVPFQIASSMMTGFLRAWHSEYMQSGTFPADSAACIQRSGVISNAALGTWSEEDDALLEDALSSVEASRGLSHRDHLNQIEPAPSSGGLLMQAVHNATYLTGFERQQLLSTCREDEELLMGTPTNSEQME